MSPTSQQRILNALNTFRPKFQRIAKSLTDFDLVLVEEGFERILLVTVGQGQVLIASRITIGYSVRWAYRPVYGAEQARSSKGTRSLPP